MSPKIYQCGKYWDCGRRMSSRLNGRVRTNHSNPTWDDNIPLQNATIQQSCKDGSVSFLCHQVACLQCRPTRVSLNLQWRYHASAEARKGWNARGCTTTENATTVQSAPWRSNVSCNQETTEVCRISALQVHNHKVYCPGHAFP
jgi:hypothetical protein